jgi:hypothetical protein
MATKQPEPRFKKVVDLQRGDNDSSGRVNIRCTLLNKRGQRIKGNLSRSVTLQDTTVGEVWNTIEKALFGE